MRIASQLPSLAYQRSRARITEEGPLDQFVDSFPGLADLSTPKVALGCVGAFMGAIPMVGAGANALAGLLSNGTPEGTGMVGMLANMGGCLAMFSGHPVLGGLGLAVSATTAFLLYTDDTK